jgi:hypothetical protein
VRFDLASAQEILRRTPLTLVCLVRDLPDGWVRHDEGPGTWSVFDVVGHLIHGERTDWIPRARVILDHGASTALNPRRSASPCARPDSRAVPEGRFPELVPGGETQDPARFLEPA